jgi:hypothetical protein
LFGVEHWGWKDGRGTGEGENGKFVHSATGGKWGDMIIWSARGRDHTSHSIARVKGRGFKEFGVLLYGRCLYRSVFCKDRKFDRIIHKIAITGATELQ